MIQLLSLLILMALPLFGMDESPQASPSIPSGVGSPNTVSLGSVIECLPDEIQAYFKDSSKCAEGARIITVDNVWAIEHKDLPEARLALAAMFLKSKYEVVPLLIHLLQKDPLTHESIERLDALIELFKPVFESKDARTFKFVEQLPFVFGRVVELYIRQSEVANPTACNPERKGFVVLFSLQKRNAWAKAAQGYAKKCGNGLHMRFAEKWLRESIKRIPIQRGDSNAQRAEQVGFVIGAVANLVIQNDIVGALKHLSSLKATVTIEKKWFDAAYPIHRIAHSITDMKQFEGLVNLAESLKANKQPDWKVVYAMVESFGHIAMNNANPGVRAAACNELKKLQEFMLPEKTFKGVPKRFRRKMQNQFQKKRAVIQLHARFLLGSITHDERCYRRTSTIALLYR